uniref:Endoplasmic reticulum metallopeptidase 1-like C-terminal domain-containing protein n=1 Tax=Ditylenchus dipsaci TaxID=166011 RepID=A0A915CN40_9BILA
MTRKNQSAPSSKSREAKFLRLDQVNYWSTLLTKFFVLLGLDIAYVKNGWVYHTEFDQTRLIHKGAIQRNGENVLSLIKALISSPYLQQPANFDEGKNWICDILWFYKRHTSKPNCIFIRAYYDCLQNNISTLYIQRCANCICTPRPCFTWNCCDCINVICSCLFAKLVYVLVFNSLPRINHTAVVFDYCLNSCALHCQFDLCEPETAFLIKCCVALCLLAIAIIITTRLGDPYKYSEDSPRLRRLLAAHSKRTVYDFGGKINSTGTGLFIQTMDYRGITDLPEHTFLQGTDKPDCSNTQDDYCQLPYYHPNFKYMKPEYSRWVPLPSSPQITKPISVHMLSRVQPVDTQLNISLVVRGGADRMALHVSPLQGYTLKEWSITKNDSILSEPKNTHYVNMNSGHEHPQETNIWILLENKHPYPLNPEAHPSLEFAVVSHYVHGAEQNSETLQQLKSLIHARRETPHHAVGFWKWAITMTGMTSEIVVHFF